MVKVKNIKDITWYNFTIVRHTPNNIPIWDDTDWMFEWPHNNPILFGRDR